MTGGVWIASYVLLWAAVLVLSAAVVALLRQIGVLHARVRPMGTHFGGEGPPLDEPAPTVPGVGFDDSPLTLVAFTAPDCEICAELKPGLRALDSQYGDVRVREVEHGGATVGVFRSFAVMSTPYVVAVDRQGIVRGRGIANTLEQVEVLVEEALERAAGSDSTGAGA